jgi:hypothetical protein
MGNRQQIAISDVFLPQSHGREGKNPDMNGVVLQQQALKHTNTNRVISILQS